MSVVTVARPCSGGGWGAGEQVLTDFATVRQGIDWGRQGVDTILFSAENDEIYTLDISLPGQMPEYVTAGNSPSFSPDNSKFVFNYGKAGGELKTPVPRCCGDPADAECQHWHCQSGESHV